MRARKQIFLCLGVAVALLTTILAPAAAKADFGLQGIFAEALNSDGSIDLEAGSHPYAYKLSFTMNQKEGGVPEGILRDVVVDLPAGLVGNPRAAERCDGATFEGQLSLCPGSSQVGVAEFTFGGGIEGVQPIYNLSTPVGVPLRLGFSLTSLNSFQEASLRGSDYGARVSDQTIPNIELQSITETIWGVPADKRHNPERWCVENGTLVHGCSTDSTERPFLSLPTSCTGPLQTTVRVASVENPEVFDSKSVNSINDNGIEAGLENCEAPIFEPKISTLPETNAADSPTGVSVGINIPQTDDPDLPAAAHLKDTTVSLPQGIVINPSGGIGLGACALEGPEGINLPKSRDPNVPEPAEVSESAKCPPNSKVGTVEIETPLLDHKVPGTVYLARELENPFGSLLALYVAIDDPISGIIVKLAGKVELDPATGQLKATFETNPQLPFENLDFKFFGGPRANLTMPGTCGAYTTNAVFTPWTTPEGETVAEKSSFPVTASATGGPCANSEAEKPNAPSFQAGTTTPLAGTYSPFVVKLSRENGSQHFAALNMTLPKGVSAKLASVAECSEAQIAQAQARSNPGQGALEKPSPSCPAASEVGTVNVGAGSGSPLYVQGRAYLAGPYKGAPLSLVIITPAIAGPFDLGAVVVRSALFVDEETAQVTVKTDPLPTILQGIPLDIRSVAVNIDRQGFSLNPTSCEPLAVTGQSISTTGAIAPLSNRFQVGGCRGLGFEPKLAISLKGRTTRGGHPALKAVVSYPKSGQYANIARAQVGLPHSEFLDQANLDNVCTRPQLRSQTCPRNSIYGRAKAWTPLLDKPLEGPVYLGVGFGHQLPDLVAELNGKVRIILHGKVDTTPQDGLRNTFEAVPDAPVSKFVLEMKGGRKYGLLRNSENVCLKDQRATANFTAQNGAQIRLRPLIKNSCKGMKPGKGKGGGHMNSRHGR